MLPTHTLNTVIKLSLRWMSDDEFSRGTEQKPPLRSDGGGSLLDRVFGALTHRRRRYILYYVREHERTDVADLAAHVAAREQNAAIENVSPSTIERVQRELVHAHLPKLDDYGLVEYDRRSDAVCYNHPPKQLEHVLDIAAAIERPD